MKIPAQLWSSARSISRSSTCGQVAQVKPKPVEKEYEMRPLKKLCVEQSKPVFYKERTIHVHSCKELYTDWKQNRPGWHHLDGKGLDLQVPYIHTGLDRGRKNAPTVVALHGSPGTHRDFDALIPALDGIGANVIVPTFPDLHYTIKTQTFWHTLEEKTDLLQKYLQNIDVNEVDVLLCHSSAMYSALQLTLNSPIKVNSLVFFAPSGCRRLTQMSPLPLFQWYGDQFRKPHLQKILLKFAVGVIKFYSKPSSDTIGTVGSMMAMIHSRYDDAGPLCRQVQEKGIPTLMMYGKRDKLIDIDISEEMAGFLGNSLKDTYYLYDGKDDTEAKMVREGLSQIDLPEVVCFEKGSHFAFRKFPEIYNYHVGNFLQREIRERLNK